MKIYLKIKKYGNVISTLDIGKKHFKIFEKNSLPSWKKYCLKNKLGLIVCTSSLSKSKEHE